jgi:hypothetical protein
MQSLIVFWKDVLWHCFLVDGANINMSRWGSSHQNGAALFGFEDDVVTVTMA